MKSRTITVREAGGLICQVVVPKTRDWQADHAKALDFSETKGVLWYRPGTARKTNGQRRPPHINRSLQ